MEKKILYLILLIVDVVNANSERSFKFDARIRLKKLLVEVYVRLVVGIWKKELTLQGNNAM